MSEAKAFTDEDLKRLKEFNEGHAVEISSVNTTVSLWSILARLSAAEEVIDAAGICKRCHGCYCSELMAWLKTCGRAK